MKKYTPTNVVRKIIADILIERGNRIKDDADIFEEEIAGDYINRDSFGLIKNRYYLKVLYGWDEKTKFDF